MTRIVTTPRPRHKRRKKPAKAVEIATLIVTATTGLAATVRGTIW